MYLIQPFLYHSLGFCRNDCDVEGNSLSLATDHANNLFLLSELELGNT